MDSWTKVLVPAIQLCPEFEKTIVACSAAKSKSASGKIILADFPPSYNVIGFRLDLWEFLMIRYPTAVDPVNDILSTKWCWHRVYPVYASPGIMLTTPGGNPASLMNWQIINAVKGVCSAGFKTIVHPAAKAGAIFQHNINNG